MNTVFRVPLWNGLLRLPILAGFVVAWLFAIDFAFGQSGNATVHTGATPSWVEAVQPETASTTKPDSGTGGQVYDLIDTQINAATAETYLHVVKEITTEAGVQSGANLSFSWDPAYQELTVHHIIIHRGAEKLDRLDPARFKIIQQETDLDRQIYDGTLSAVLFLEDVQPGDRIEYDFTLRGRNPSLNGRYADTLLLGWPVPVERRHIRLVWPDERHLNYAAHGLKADPEILHHDGLMEYIWDLHEPPVVIAEDQLPSWFMPYPWLQLSEFPDWQSVANWAAGLFITTNNSAPEIQAEVAALKQPGLTDEQLVDRALRFAQNQVRYLGLEFGPYSYRPTDPALVLQHRFGDCKDKAFLLCTLLRGMGFAADPVLVATGFRQTLSGLLPSPGDFDHAIVRVLVDGRTYWLDPTRTYQHGSIADRYRPDYGYGLLVKAGETKLVSIPAANANVASTVTREHFLLGGQRASSLLDVTTTFYGFDAEYMRAILASTGRDRLAKSYLNDYARRYPGITLAAPLQVNDSSDADELTIHHTYAITNFWVLSEDKQRYTCQFYPLGIHSWITKPSTAVRLMPMDIPYPRHRVVQTRIDLPRLFKLTDYTNTITGPAGSLHIERTFKGQSLALTYDYRTSTDFIPVSLAAPYLASLDRMEDALGYSLQWQNMDGVGKASQFNWPIFMLVAFYTAAFAAGAGILCHRLNRKFAALAAGPPPFMDQHLKGLGGWLILVGFGLVFGPLRILASVVKTADGFALWKWHALTSPGGVSYHPLWGPMLTYELLGQISLIITAVVALILFFQKRRLFPRWFIGFMILNAAFVLIDMVGMHFLGYSTSASMAIRTKNIMSLFVGCGIWIPYMLTSRRVRVTFDR